VNPHALLASRVALTGVAIVMLGGMVFLVAFHPPENPEAQRILDGVTGGVLILVTTSFSWFFGSTAGVMQANATIAKQSEMLASAQPSGGNP
jgi:hypothetical protein